MTTSVLVKHIESALALGLIPSAILLSEFSLALPGVVSPKENLQIVLSSAKALLANHEHRRARQFYLEALKARAKIDSSDIDITSTAEIRFQIYKCHIGVGEERDALTVLSAIPVSQRTIEMTMAIGKLYSKFNVRTKAVECFKQVLQACPLALNVVLELVQLGEDMEPHFDMNLGLARDQIQWLKTWARGHRAASKKNYSDAVNEFVAIKEKTPGSISAAVSPHVLMHLADWQWKQGHLPGSRVAFEQARRADMLNMDKMDIYAHVLVAQGREADLNVLCAELMGTDNRRVEAWLALARYYQLLCENSLDEHQAMRHAKQGLVFVDKAATLNKSHAEVHMVKGTLLLALDSPREASAHFREAYSTSRDFSPYQGLVSCYIAESRLTEALAVAKDAQQHMPLNPRALTLLGVVLKRYANGSSKARRLFDRALVLRSDCMDAVFALFDLELDEENFDAAIKLLQPHLNHSRVDYVHRRLGDAHLLNQNVDMALKHYHLALSVNPEYEPAKEGIAAAMKALHSSTADVNDHDHAQTPDLDGSPSFDPMGGDELGSPGM
eukprot:m.227595 g.227595  ORF g.227595 m.227595 type:complete len:556 (-) comp19249_c0_seq1:203-1870(-)